MHIKSFFYKPTIANWSIGLLILLLSVLVLVLSSIYPPIDYAVSVVFYALFLPFALQLCERKDLKLKKSLRILSACMAFLFSQFICIGESFYLAHNLSLLFGSVILMGLWLVKSFLYGWIAYKIVSEIIYRICSCQLQQDDSILNLKRLFWVNVATRLFCQFCYFPCCFDYDGGGSLRTFLDPDVPLSAHHPFFVQLLQIGFYRIGQFFGNPSIGMALLTVLLIFAGSSVVIYGVKVLKMMGSPSKWIRRVAYLFAFFPLFPIVSVFPTKDGMFAYAFLYYCLTLLQLYLSNGSCLTKGKYLWLHGLAFLLVCLTRHQGIYIVAIEAVALLFVYRKRWQRLTLSVAPALCASLLFTKVLLPIWGVVPGGKQEVLGILFQQTAYCLKCDPNSATIEERESINAILNADTIAAHYKYTITDPVKMYYRADKAKEIENLRNYMDTWWSMLLRHPFRYIEAHLGVFHGFFYNRGSAIIGFDWVWMHTATKPEYAFDQFLGLTLNSNRIVHTSGLFPPLSWLASVPYYLWFATLLLLLIVYKRDYRAMVMALPIFLSMCVLLICPVSDGRYTYPIVFTLPFLFVFVLNNHPQNNVDHEEDSRTDTLL